MKVFFIFIIYRRELSTTYITDGRLSILAFPTLEQVILMEMLGFRSFLAYIQRQ